MEVRTLPEVQTTADETSDRFKDFAHECLTKIDSHLETNRERAAEMTDISEKVVDVTSPDNIDHLQVRARPLENPRVTLWLKDCPVWANDAWEETIYPFGINAYNGDVEVTFDVRPF